MFRLLNANEIQIRVNQVRSFEKEEQTVVKASYLLYKDARCDMNILDETVGPFNWQKSYTRENANCIVSIYDEKKQEWISKEDTGTESNTEAEKGLASDSFKRACFNWGIGRELYTAPNIVITLTEKEFYKKNDKIVPTANFSVKEIEYKNREISYLEIVDQQGNTRFVYGQKNNENDFAKAVEELNKLNISLDDEKVQKWISEKSNVDFKNNFNDLEPTSQKKVIAVIYALIKAKKGK